MSKFSDSSKPTPNLREKKIRSRTDELRLRTSNLEAQLDKLLSLTEGSPNSSSKEEDIKNNVRGNNYLDTMDYIVWLKQQIIKYRKEGSFRWPFSNKDTTSSTDLSSNTYENIDKIEIIESRISKNLIQYGSPALIKKSKPFNKYTNGRTNTINILNNGIFSYHAFLDQSSFWLNKQELHSALRNEKHTLLKGILIDVFSTMEADKEPNSNSFISYENTLNLLPISYMDPSLDNIIGLSFLVVESIMVQDYLKAKTFLSSAFRMAEMLNIQEIYNEELHHKLINPDSTLNKRKKKVWEILFFLYISVIQSLPGPPLVDVKYIYSFDHIRDTEFTTPTCNRIMNLSQLSRYCNNADGPKKKKLVLNTCSSVNLKKLDSSGKSLYQKSLVLYLRVYNFCLLSKYKFNSQTVLPEETFPIVEFDRMKLEMDLLTDQFKPYLSFLFKFDQNINNYKLNGKAIPTLYSHLIPFAFIAVYTSNLLLNYPKLALNPGPCYFKKQEAWINTLEAASKISELFFKVYKIKSNPKHGDLIQVIPYNFTLYAIYVYLNAIMHLTPLHQPNLASVDQLDRYFQTAQNLIFELENIANIESKNYFKALDASSSLKNLKETLPKFVLPKCYKICFKF